jgi:YVTN family beta-propeller protein
MNEKATPQINVTYPAGYVVNSKDNSISIIDLTDNTVKDKINLPGSYPYHIYISPNKKLLAVSVTNVDLSGGFPIVNYSSYNSGNKVIVIDAVTKEIVKEISLPKLASNALFNFSNSELWIGQSDDIQSSMLVYNISNWTLTNTIPLGKGLGEITFCSDGDMSFSTTSGDDSVQMYNVSDKSFLMSTSLPSHPIGAWASNYHTDFIVCDVNNRIYELNATDCLLLDSMLLSFRPGHTTYVACKNELWVSDVTNGKVAWFTKTGSHWSQQGTIAVGNNPRWLQVDNVSSVVYVANQNDNTVSVIDVNSHSVSKTISVGNAPSCIAIKK